MKPRSCGPLRTPSYGASGQTVSSAPHTPPAVASHARAAPRYLLRHVSPTAGYRFAPGLMTFAPRPFHPASWARDAHTQTLGARILRPPAALPFRRERIETPDGDFLDLDWNDEPVEGSPIVLVIHGLEGSASRRYVTNVCRELHARGIRPVAMNLRGCSGEPNRALQYYH